MKSALIPAAQASLVRAVRRLGLWYRRPRCPVCRGRPRPRTGYGRAFSECIRCGFLWCHDFPEQSANEGMGLVGSWGGPEKGGERDDFMVRMLQEYGPRRRVLVYGAGTTLVFRVLLTEGYEVFGADISREVVAYREAEFPGRFLHAPDLDSARHHFDIITACEVFEHFHDPLRWVRGLVGNLAEGGTICGSTNFYPGHGPIEDDQRIGYMSLKAHVAYWSERSMAHLFDRFGMQTVFFELVCPGSVKPDRAYQSLFPNKRLFFATADSRLVHALRERRKREPILPCDTSDYPVAAYREG